MRSCFFIGCSSETHAVEHHVLGLMGFIASCELECSSVAPVSHLKALRASKSFEKLATLSGRHGEPGKTFSACVRACTNFCKLLACCSQNLSKRRGGLGLAWYVDGVDGDTTPARPNKA